MGDINVVLWGGIGIAVVLVLLIIYMYLKEGESNKRSRRYEKSIEELNKEVYRLQKRIKEQESALEHYKVGIKAKIYQDTLNTVKMLDVPLSESDIYIDVITASYRTRKKLNYILENAVIVRNNQIFSSFVFLRKNDRVDSFCQITTLVQLKNMNPPIGIPAHSIAYFCSF